MESNIHMLPEPAVFVMLQSKKGGLTEEEAAERAEEVGKNELSKKALKGLGDAYDQEAEATVVRGGEEKTVPRVDLVPGDVVIIRVGDTVPCDMRLIHVDGLKVTKTYYTGEAEPVVCTAEMTTEHELSEWFMASNMAMLANVVVDGMGTGVVFATGHSTLIHPIAENLMPAGGKKKCSVM